MTALTPTAKNSSAINIARHGHEKHAPLTAPSTSPRGATERRLLDLMETYHCWPWAFADLVKRFPAPNPSWPSDSRYVSHMLRGLKAVGEVAYNPRTRTWKRTP